MKLHNKKAHEIDRVPNRKLYLEPSDNQNILGQVDMPLCGSQISHNSRDVAMYAARAFLGLPIILQVTTETTSSGIFTEEQDAEWPRALKPIVI